MTGKKKILIVVGYYYPGTKHGGILRSVENTVNYLRHDFEFYILTRDHDIGEKKPYDNITTNKWISLGNGYIFYLDSTKNTTDNIWNVIESSGCDVLHLNSLFDLLTIKVLIGIRLGKVRCKRVILSPRGEFGWASFKIRLYKKILFLIVAKITGILRNLLWHVSTGAEKNDLLKILKVSKKFVFVAKDLPLLLPEEAFLRYSSQTYNSKLLKIVFISRISPEKNLHFAIDIMSKIKCQVVFDIYGPIDDEKYWYKCKKQIDLIPEEGVTISYKGIINPGSVIETFSKYDLFFFPTGGENYGHVIVESLSAGTFVLTTNNTCWNNLERDGFGWNVDLRDQRKFINLFSNGSISRVIDNRVDRFHICNGIRKRGMKSDDLNMNKELYKNL